MNTTAFTWARRFLGLFVPPDEHCLHCGRTLSTPREDRFGLCGACLDRVAWIRRPVCDRCGKPLRSAQGDRCHDCRARTVPFACSLAPAVYDGMWRDLIQQLKFYGRRELARPLGAAMAQVAERARLGGRAHALVPVPLHPKRLERRGYNQALALAMEVSEETGIPVLEALIRAKAAQHGGAQSLRTARERRRSLRGAFTVWQPDAVRGLTLVVVDDVYTTGATMDEAARALLRAGAGKVLGLVAAVGLTDADLAGGGGPHSNGGEEC